MPFYEHTVIVRQDLSTQQAQGLAEQFTQVVSDQGGQVTKSEYWGLRNLAFRISKNRKGHYIHLNLDAPSGAVQELERNERFNEDVLRYLTVKVDKLTESPSMVMQTRSSRDDRGGRRDRDRDRGERDRGDRDRGERDRPQGGEDRTEAKD